MTRAAVLTGDDSRLHVCEIEVEDPHAGEVLITIAATGVCHTDSNLRSRVAELGIPTPLVLGHEAAGVVVAVGPGVGHLEAGDHVIVMPAPQCGGCFFCKKGNFTLCEKVALARTGGLFDGTPRLRLNGNPLYQLSCAGTFSEATVIPASSAVKIDSRMPLPQAALIGCAVATGVGAATQVATITGGETVAVIGCGGIGLNVVQGARLAGAGRIVAIDTVGSKLALAETFGATDVVDASDGTAVGQVKALTGGYGADITFEVVGIESTIRQMLEMTRPGGECVLTGVGSDSVSLRTGDIVSVGKTLKGNFLGMRSLEIEFPRLVEMYMDGRLLLDELISGRIELSQVNEAFDALDLGEVARTVIVN